MALFYAEGRARGECVRRLSPEKAQVVSLIDQRAPPIVIVLALETVPK